MRFSVDFLFSHENENTDPIGFFLTIWFIECILINVRLNCQVTNVVKKLTVDGKLFWSVFQEK